MVLVSFVSESATAGTDERTLVDFLPFVVGRRTKAPAVEKESAMAEKPTTRLATLNFMVFFVIICDKLTNTLSLTNYSSSALMSCLKNTIVVYDTTGMMCANLVVVTHSREFRRFGADIHYPPSRQR